MRLARPSTIYFDIALDRTGLLPIDSDQYSHQLTWTAETCLVMFIPWLIGMIPLGIMRDVLYGPRRWPSECS